MSMNYRTVTSKFRGIAGKTVIVDQPNARGYGTVFLARSLIHGADDSKFDGLFIGEEFTFRLADWKAEEIGWA